MGNCSCCPTSNPCDHTVDETQGLLNSPDSKVPARPVMTDGISQALEGEESSKNEADCTKQEEDVVSTQPVAAPKPVEALVQSSYGSVIQMLHTDVSLTAQTSQSASAMSKVSEEQMDAAITGTKTKTDDEIMKENQTSATEVTDALDVKVPTELDTAKVKDETEAQIPDTLEKEDKADEPKLIAQDALAKGPADELHEVQVDTQMEVSKEDIEKRSAEADKNEDTAEINKKEEAGEVDTKNEELKTTVEVLPAMDSVQANEPDLINSAVVEVAENSADILKSETSSVEHLASSSDPSCEVEPTVLAVEKPLADDVLENHEEHVVSNMSEIKDSLPSKTQETSEQESSPTTNISEESTVNYIENGQADDLTGGERKDENPAESDVEVPQLAEMLQKPCEDLSHIENHELKCEPPANDKSASISEAAKEPESTDMAGVQKASTECLKTEEDVTEALQNGLHTCASVEKPESTEKPEEQVDENELESKPTDPLDHDRTEPAHQTHENDETTAGNEEENKSNHAQKGEIVFSSSHDTKVVLIPVRDIENIARKEKLEDTEDLYRGDDELKQEQAKEIKPVPLLEFTIPGVEEKCSLAAPVDMLAYSEREWKGNTAKSNLIRKGYSEISCSFTGLRRVRGDNYCSLRATLYQVLSTTTSTPDWLMEEDFTSLPEKIEAQEHLIGMWVFPSQCVKAGEEEENAVEKLKHYLELLQKRWQAAAESENLEDKLGMCERVFQGGEEEYALLEVLKFLMLVKAMELYSKMQAEEDVPVFCWLLFARDTSENPKMFFRNHLSQVGFSGGLEQVEMFLLGYALQHTIQAFRLYKTDTEEFVTHYPDDHKQDWPCVSIITEDDRHYNVPVRKPRQYL